MRFQQQIELNDFFLPIIGYEDLYEVSFFGRIRNVRTNRILVPINSSGSYHQVSLRKNNVSKVYFIHRLVATAFIPNIKNVKYVDHMDHNKTNNTVYNLRWASSSDNNRNARLSKRNTSGYQGVRYMEHNGTGYWVARWYDEKGIPKQKNYSLKKFENAKDLAIGWRDQMVLQYYNRK